MTERERELRLEAFSYMKEHMAPWDWEDEYDRDPLGEDLTMDQIADGLEDYFDEDAPAELICRIREFTGEACGPEEEDYPNSILMQGVLKSRPEEHDGVLLLNMVHNGDLYEVEVRNRNTFSALMERADAGIAIRFVGHLERRGVVRIIADHIEMRR